LLLW